MTETERDREKERETEKERQRERETEKDRKSDKEKETKREGSMNMKVEAMLEKVIQAQTHTHMEDRLATNTDKQMESATTVYAFLNKLTGIMSLATV